MMMMQLKYHEKAEYCTGMLLSWGVSCLLLEQSQIVLFAMANCTRER